MAVAITYAWHDCSRRIDESIHCAALHNGRSVSVGVQLVQSPSSANSS